MWADRLSLIITIPVGLGVLASIAVDSFHGKPLWLLIALGLWGVAGILRLAAKIRTVHS